MEVVEVLVDAESTYERIMHRTPVMKVNDNVLPKLTEVSFIGCYVVVKLAKKCPNVWKKLFIEKYSFVRIDPDVEVLDDDEDQCDASPDLVNVGVDSRRVAQDIKFEFDQDDSSYNPTDSEEFDDNDAEDEKDLLL